MRDSILAIVLTTILALTAGCRTEQTSTDSQSRYAAMLESLYQQDSVTIVLTDSGLGGLSVTAALDKMFRDDRAFRQVQLIFANALPERGYAYNQMQSVAEKAHVFSAALDGMNENLHPDIILIACNTLSVVYPETEFAKSSKTPVIGIVEFGVDRLYAALSADPASSVIIMGTPTTIGQHSHADGLEARGVKPARITTQACEMLESEIQAAPHSDMVGAMIEMFASEALARDTSGGGGELVVGLCCSHYGFSRDLFQRVFDAATDRPVRVVDPNEAMEEFMIPEKYKGRFETTDVSVHVVSRAELLPEERASISAAVLPISPATATAVVDYTYDTNLFSLEGEQ